METDMSDTTLNEIRSHRPCEELWEKLLEGLGKTKADDEPLPYSTILKVCGLDDTLWAIVCCHPRGLRICAEFALWCAEGVRHLMRDPRSIAALGMARQYLEGNTTFDQLQEAVAAAWAAAWAADYAGYAAACAAGWAAASSGASNEADWASDWVAGRTVAHAASCSAACLKDWTAARTAQNSKLVELLEGVSPLGRAA
jgi:hypothetical protein